MIQIIKNKKEINSMRIKIKAMNDKLKMILTATASLILRILVMKNSQIRKKVMIQIPKIKMMKKVMKKMMNEYYYSSRELYYFYN